MKFFVVARRHVTGTFIKTFKMASFSLKQEKDNKCRSLNSPVFLKKYSRNQKFRAEALSHDDRRKESLESSHSLMEDLQFNFVGRRKKMEAVSGCSFLKFENEKNSKHSPSLLPMNTYEASFLSDNLVSNKFNLSSSVSNEFILPYNASNKAIFTIHLPSFQILVVNSAACQLINYSSDELCSITMEKLLIDSQRHKLSKLYKKYMKSSNEIPLYNGKLMELVRKDGEAISVFIYLKKLDNPERCLVIAEPVDRESGLISVDESGKILSCDDIIALTFQYDASEIVGVSLYTLIPAINLFTIYDEQWKKISKQQLTGRTKNGEAFPLSLAISYPNPGSKEYKIMAWVYTDLSGLILINKKLQITNFNGDFIKLLFGFSKKEVLNLPIVNLIPTFCKDIGFEKFKKSHFQANNVNDINLSYWCGKNDLHEDWSENFIRDESFTSLQSNCSLSFNNLSDSSKKYEGSNASPKMASGTDNELKTLYMNNSKTNPEYNNFSYCEAPFQKGIHFEKKVSPTNLICQKKEKDYAEQKEKIVDCCCINPQNIVVQEGKFLGFARHKDGSFIHINYQVKITGLSEDNFYCVWLSEDMFRFSDLSKEFCSFNSLSVDGSLPKDSACSEQFTRPSTASLISQCDENLTAGEYSKYYSNIRQIGKGAFGYVKMAFRNSDGLLVVTKFIKKQSINVRSWVFHSNLNMRIPLEISLLTTLRHRNIVKVLDVFHNDSFVQLVMEKHGAGFDLFEFINRGPKCDEKLKSYIFRQIISAVYYLNSLGILHRDIKDENVIINEKFEIKLIDFGSATFMPPNETFSKFYGTVEYCSPEVLQGNAYKGPELEIWALGVTLYVLTFGENPFCNIEETIEGQFSIPFQISQELDDLLHKMLDKNVETRITIDKVAQHSWINQPVSIGNYRFEEIVNCSDEEAYPPKYVHEISLEDIIAKDSKTDNVQSEDSNNLSGSLQNLAELDDFDENFQEARKSSFSECVGRKINLSSVMLSSTPMQYKNDRLTKSTIGVPNRLENSLSFSDCSYKCCKSSYIENEFLLQNNYLKHHKTASFSGNESGDLEEILGISEICESELEMRLKSCCLFGEENYKMNSLSKSEVFYSVSEVHKPLNENECGSYSEAEDDIDNDCFNPN